MNAIPAKIAGVKNLIMVVPTPGGEQNDLVFAAAMVAGVDKVFTIGGAQAIASMAYGTETIPKVDKIVGPGNAYVAEAKRLVFGTVGIDMIAGPSEITIICDGKTNPDWIAMDLFSQAEHDELARPVLVTHVKSIATKVQAELEKQLKKFDRAAIAKVSLATSTPMNWGQSWRGIIISFLLGELTAPGPPLRQRFELSGQCAPRRSR